MVRGIIIVLAFIAFSSSVTGCSKAQQEWREFTQGISAGDG